MLFFLLSSFFFPFPVSQCVGVAHLHFSMLRAKPPSIMSAQGRSDICLGKRYPFAMLNSLSSPPCCCIHPLVSSTANEYIPGMHSIPIISTDMTERKKEKSASNTQNDSALIDLEWQDVFCLLFISITRSSSQLLGSAAVE